MTPHDRFREKGLFYKMVGAFLVMVALNALAGGFGVFFIHQAQNRVEYSTIKMEPLKDTTASMRVAMVKAHLALEESLNDLTKNPQEIWDLFDEGSIRGEWILQGGRDGDQTIYPAENPAIRAIVEDLQKRIGVISILAHEIRDNHERSMGVGSDADQKYDENYARVQKILKELENNADTEKEIPSLVALSEARYLLANNHLFFEESLGGDTRNEYDFAKTEKTLEDIERLISNSAVQSEDPLRDEALKWLHDLHKLTIERYEHTNKRRVWLREADIRLNKAFEEFYSKANEAEVIVENQVNASMDALQTETQASVYNMLLISLLSMVTGLILAFVLAGRVARPVSMLADSMSEIARSGDFSIRVPVTSADEIGRLSEAFNIMAQSTEEKDWIKSGNTAITNVVQQSSNHHQLAQNGLSELAPLFGAGYGLFLVLNEVSDQFEILGTFGAEEELDRSRAVRRGDGIAGQAALEGRRIIMDEIPSNFVKIHSAMGAAPPLSFLAIPVVHQGRVLAVIELASFHPFTPLHHALLDTVLPAIALGLEGLNRLRQTEELLEEAQRQSEELEMQQEELRQTNENLHEQTRKLEESENELKAQQEELRQTNEELEAKALQLSRNQTALEEANAEVAEKAAYLEQASRYKSEFLANMSHELRTPLNSMLILSKIFADNETSNLSDEQVESAEIIHSSGIDLLNLINDILDLAKIEAGRMELKISDIEVSSFMDKLRRTFLPVAEQKGLELNVVFDDNAPEMLRSDPQRLEQVLKNLLSNSLKFTEKGNVTLRIGRPIADVSTLAGPLAPQDAVSLAVADSGIGISPEKIRIIFEAFQQADGGISRTYGGTGLGLSISRELARLLGGEILVESLPGKGSCFTLVIPEMLKQSSHRTPEAMHLRQSTMTSHAAPPIAPHHPTPQLAPQPQVDPDISERIPNDPLIEGENEEDDRLSIMPNDKVVLVIEDDPNFFSVINRIAHQKGYKCLNALNGSTGLTLAQKYHLMGIILDPGLPDIDGWTVLERLKANTITRQVPVHVISASEFGGEVFDRGAIGSLVKPVSVEQINEVCKRFEQISGNRPRHILLVEDDENSAKAVTKLIARKHVKVTVAETGAVVMSMLRNQRFDCMILDLMLPDIGGFELLDQIAQEDLPHPPPVIVYSGKELTKEEHHKLREYTHSIIVKGVESSERLGDEIALFLHSVEQKLPEQQRHKPTMPLHEAETLFTNKRVLVVDDDMRNTFALKRVLSMKGIQVLVAANGQKAVDILENNPDGVDLVLMDIMMPVMDGYQAIHAIRSQDRFVNLPIIVLSAKAMIEDRTRCMEAGANDFLPKPVDVDRLYSMLRVWLYGGA